jgi:hypothetical protein
MINAIFRSQCASPLSESASDLSDARRQRCRHLLVEMAGNGRKWPQMKEAANPWFKRAISSRKIDFDQRDFEILCIVGCLCDGQ